MNFFISIIIWWIGWIFASFSIGNIFLTLFFAIPFTNKLDNEGLVEDKKAIISGCILTVVIQVILFAIVALIVNWLASKYIVVYFASMIIPALIVLSKCSATENNVNDYMIRFQKFLK